MRSALLLLTLAAMACASPAPEPPQAAAEPAAADTSLVRRVGTVRVVGSAPLNIQVMLQDQGGRGVAIHGPLAREIERLSGVEVEVQGRMHQGALEASGYQVRAVDGAPAVMGTVERATDGGLQLRTEQGQILKLSGADAHLRAGQKVWVQGTQTLQVQSYGVIRP